MEDFLVRRRLDGMNFGELSARQVESFLILEQELATEIPERQRSSGTSAARRR